MTQIATEASSSTETARTSPKSDKPQIVTFSVVAGTVGKPKAMMTIAMNGRHYSAEETSAFGPLDATARAINQIVPHKAEIVSYAVRAKGRGSHVQAEVKVTLEVDGRRAKGVATHCDTNLASARAYMGALNQLDDPK